MSIPGLGKMNGKIDRRVRAILAITVTLAVIAAWFINAEIPREFEALALFSWGYYFGQPTEPASHL